MPRPQKNGIDYFPLDVNFFSDPKIKILKARYGVDGIAVYVYLLCEIYRAGYYLRLNQDSIYIISDDLKMSAEKVMQIMNFLLERSLLDSTLFQSDKILTSAGIQKRFQLAVKERAKKNPVEIKGFWLLDETETEPFIKVNPILNKSQKKEDNSGKNDGNSREISLKESKGKKSKENKTISADQYASDERLNQAILDYIAYRKDIKKPMSNRAIELMMKKLNELSTSTDDQIRILHQSIINGWQGIFPLKNKKKKSAGKEPVPNSFHNFEERDTDYDVLVSEQVKEWIRDPESGTDHG